MLQYDDALFWVSDFRMLWKCTVEESQTIATSVIMHYFEQSILESILKMHNGEKANNCNQCDYALFWASDFRKHMKMHSGGK